MEKRSKVIEYFIARGKEQFSHRIQDNLYNVDRSAIVQWLWLQSVEEGAKLELLEINEIVRQVHAFSNQVGITHGMTAKDLREKIAALPDNVPILYERIEDKYFVEGNWSTKKAVSDVRKVSPKEVEYYKNNPIDNIELHEKNGEVLAHCYSNYVDVFAGYVTTDENGLKVFVVTAHY